jgi:hypothetical protein
MRAHDRGVDDCVFVICVSRQYGEEPFPDTACGPAAEAPMGIVPVTERFWQVAPRNAGTVTIDYRVYEAAVVHRCRADGTCPSRQHSLDPVPLVVTKASLAHRSAFDEADALRIDECPAPEALIANGWALYHEPWHIGLGSSSTRRPAQAAGTAVPQATKPTKSNAAN